MARRLLRTGPDLLQASEQADADPRPTTARMTPLSDGIQTGWRRWLGGAALVVLVAVLLVDLAKLLSTAALAIGYPYDLDYGEGIVWQQMDNIAAGCGYAPLGIFPAIVYHYPPVYHLVVAAVAALTGGDALATGRAVSLVSTLAAMAMIGWLASKVAATSDRASLAIGALVAALAFAASPTVLTWAPLMRVDMLATALTIGGLCLTVRSLRDPEQVPVGAAILFALAVYTKQTAILAPLAAFVALLVVRQRTAWLFAAICGALGLAALAVLMVASHGQFLRHVLSYNVNRFDPDRWRLLVATLSSQAIPLAIALAVAAGMGRTLVRSPARLVLGLYFASRLATLPLSLKSGASDNYLIDLFSVAAIFVGVGAAEVAAAVIRGAAWPRAFVTLLLLVALPVQAARLGEAHDAARDPDWRSDAEAIVERIKATPKPVVSDYMVLTRRAGRPVLFEPAIAAELAHSGLYDEAGFVRLIRRGKLGFFVTQGDGQWYAERYNPAVRAAIAAAYPRIERHGEMVLHLPAIATTRAGPAAPPRR